MLGGHGDSTWELPGWWQHWNAAMRRPLQSECALMSRIRALGIQKFAAFLYKTVWNGNATMSYVFVLWWRNVVDSFTFLFATDSGIMSCILYMSALTCVWVCVECVLACSRRSTYPSVVTSFVMWVQHAIMPLRLHFLRFLFSMKCPHDFILTFSCHAFQVMTMAAERLPRPPKSSLFCSVGTNNLVLQVCHSYFQHLLRRFPKRSLFLTSKLDPIS